MNSDMKGWITMNWQALKSGSDVRGTAVGDGCVLTQDVVTALGMAFVHFLTEVKGKKASDISVAIGRDSRITGPAIMNAVSDGIRKAGGNSIIFDLCTTPAMYMSTITEGFQPDGAIMITASHHPWNKNGLKFFTCKGGLEGKDVAAIIEYASSLHPEGMPLLGTLTEKAFLPVYTDQLKKRIRDGLGTNDEMPLTGLHIVVDAGNGAGGFYAQMLKELGADISGSQFLEPDGRFPNHIPNPENPEAMNALRNAVLQADADLGVIFDADCDRAAIADRGGKEINRNRLIALISAILLESQPHSVIVTDSVTSSGLKEFIENHGGEHYRYKRGYRNVIDEAIRLNADGRLCPLAIETSGHAALKENHFLDDGMYLVTVLIVKAKQMKEAGKVLSSLIQDLKEPVESAEIRMSITASDFREKGQDAISLVTSHADKNKDWHIAPDNREGIRILVDLDGIREAAWFLLRLSVHDPVLPLNAESNVPGGVKKMMKELYTLLESMDGIDTSSLKSAAEE